MPNFIKLQIANHLLEWQLPKPHLYLHIKWNTVDKILHSSLWANVFSTINGCIFWGELYLGNSNWSNMKVLNEANFTSLKVLDLSKCKSLDCTNIDRIQLPSLGTQSSQSKTILCFERLLTLAIQTGPASNCFLKKTCPRWRH